MTGRILSEFNTIVLSCFLVFPIIGIILKPRKLIGVIMPPVIYTFL